MGIIHCPRFLSPWRCRAGRTGTGVGLQAAVSRFFTPPDYEPLCHSAAGRPNAQCIGGGAQSGAQLTGGKEKLLSHLLHLCRGCFYISRICPIQQSNIQSGPFLWNIFAQAEYDYCKHLRLEHNLSPMDLEEAEVRAPRVNSQGKVKQFKCKQCEFVAVTKLEFWRHGFLPGMRGARRGEAEETRA